MTDRFLILERNEVFSDAMLLTDDDNNIFFEDIMEMSPEEANNNHSIEFQQFVVEMMDKSDEYFEDPGTTFVGVVDPEEKLVWGIMIERIDDEKIRYVSVDLDAGNEN